MELIPLLYLLCPWFGVTAAQEIRPGVVNVPEGGHALLPCGLDSGQSIDEFDWRKDNGEKEKMEVFMYDRGSYYGYNRKGQDDQFIDRVEFFQHELKSGNASIMIKNTRLEDNGTYTCGLGLHKPHRKEINIRLNVGGVLKIRNCTGAARSPNIKITRDEITWKELKCTVEGIPKPEIQWRNSDGEELSKYIPKSEDGPSRVELKVNVTRSDTYVCVATQWDIFHQINDTQEVTIPDAVAVSKGNNAVLPCSLDSKGIENMVFSWKKDDKEVFFYNRGQVQKDEQFTERLTLFPNELKSGNISIEIHNAQMTDSGRYTCYFENIQKSDIMLHVAAAAGTKSDFFATAVTGWIVAGILILAIIIIAIIRYCLKKKRSAEHKRQQHYTDELQCKIFAPVT